MGTNTRYGIYEGQASSDPTSAKNNAIFDAGTGGTFVLYFDNDNSQGFTNICSGNFGNATCSLTLSTPSGSGNVNATGLSQVFMYYPTDIVYTQDGPDGNTTYDGNTTTLEVADSTTCSKFAVNEYFEYFYDNTARKITGTDCVTNRTVTFTPALTYDFGAGTPILLWGTNNTNYDKKYALKIGSPSLDSGLVGTTNGGSCTNYTSKTHIWGSGTSQTDCDTKFPHAKSKYNAGNCETTYLYPAIEILDDNIGNDNGLCESNETCLHNPNIGAYAGHGTLSTYTACDSNITSAGFTGIVLKKYDSNGY
ncbi:MAG: hypothetical protein D6767_07155 [Candidatus Hydrogenedentota bacterium]|nr:MAG: hypothetical protein D6767_07155 [Candidatus Hydrogenedentota bacterium]